MKRFEVILSDRAKARLFSIETYIADESSRSIARRYVDGIVAKCDALTSFPLRGTPRDDLAAGLRTVSVQTPDDDRLSGRK